jgi:hypothetical protein
MSETADILMQVVEEFAAFLDLGSSDELSPEFASWGRMRLSTLLAQLPDAGKRELSAFLERQHELSTDAYGEWIDGLPSRLGLSDIG